MSWNRSISHRTVLWLFAAICVVSGIGGCAFLRGYASGHSESLNAYDLATLRRDDVGAVRFVFDDFGGLDTDTLKTNAVPWKLVSTALVLRRWPDLPPSREHLREVLQGYGFIFPHSLKNWPLGQVPQFDLPLGLVNGQIRRSLPRVQLEGANLGCASCHAGVTYDSAGQPQPDAWLGLPNTSLDLDAYVDAVFSSLRIAAPQRERTLAAVKVLYPETTPQEMATLRRFVWPKLVKRVTEAGNAGGYGLPFRNGSPGATNGVAALKFQLSLLHDDAGFDAAVSIPDLGYQRLRSALLVDGVYTHRGATRFAPSQSLDRASTQRVADVVAFFTVPTMGLRPQRAEAAIAPVDDVMQFLAGYEAPAFPGTIDAAAATRGASLYASACASCHGHYDDHLPRPQLIEFPNRLSPLAEIGTDPYRTQAIDAPLVAAVRASRMGGYIDASFTGGYVAPSLSGVWATAPYLHNGSVPTLWHLMHPRARPVRFRVGGHALDFLTVGIAGQLEANGDWDYAAGYRPWSQPRLYDTTAPGHSNRGHEREFDGLSEQDKRDLVEYLKRL